MADVMMKRTLAKKEDLVHNWFTGLQSWVTAGSDMRSPKCKTRPTMPSRTHRAAQHIKGRRQLLQPGLAHGQRVVLAIRPQTEAREDVCLVTLAVCLYDADTEQKM